MTKTSAQNSKRNFQLRQKYLDIFRRQKTKAKAIHSLKNIVDVESLREVQKSVGTIMPTLTDEIEGCLFPRDFRELCSTFVTFIPPVSLHSELVWLCSYLINYQDEIKWFVAKKSEFEQAFLLGKFDDCFELLQEVKSKLGVSLWYYESMFQLFEYWDKHKEAIMLMSSCLEEIKDTEANHLRIVFYLLNRRCTTTVSPYKFDEDLDALFKKKNTQLQQDFCRYVLFRLNMYNNIDQEDLSFNMMFESLSALVDRYLMAVNVLKAAAMNNRIDKDLLSRVRYFYFKTHDKELLPLMALDANLMEEGYYNDAFIRLIDGYYKGDYENTLQRCREYVATDASQFDVLVIYCHSLVYLETVYVNIHPEPDAPVNKLCQRIYDVLTVKEDRDYVYLLYQMNKNLYGFHLAAPMHVFVMKELNKPVSDKFRALWSSCFDPDLASSLYIDSKDARAYIEACPSCATSTACQEALAKLDGEKLAPDSAPCNVRVPHNAYIKMAKNDYDAAFKLWKAFYEHSANWLPNRQKAVRNMVKCLHDSGQTDKAITLYVDYLVTDQAATTKVDTESIVTYLQDNLYEGFRRNIDLAIFMGLNCNDGVDKSFILFEFCEAKGVNLPSELIGRLDEPLDRQEVFFAILNDDETLRHYFNIPSLRKRLNERLRIINHLISMDTVNRDAYLQMQIEVNDALSVYHVSKTLNEGKIYANDQAILKYKLKELDGLYNRFMNLFDMTINDKDTVNAMKMDDAPFADQSYEDEEVKTKAEIRTNGLYEVFLSLYGYVLDQFLYSEFGLVAYLSTRVRHGELESKLRPELTQRNLILSMKDHVYQENPYWREQFSLSEAENAIVYNALAKFSDGFDKAVFDLIKERLQIYDPNKKPNGLFNYMTNEKELSLKAIEIGQLTAGQGKEEFCRQIITWLWQQTESCLTDIRHYISGEFSAKINELFETLKSDLRTDSLPTGHIQAYLQSAIADASSVIASRLKAIECWFNITGTKLEDDDIKQLTYQVYNSIVAAYPQFNVTEKPLIEGRSFMIKASYVLHYADLLRNLLSNMFMHGVADADGNTRLVLNISITDDAVFLHFENDVEPGSEEQLNHKFAEKLSGQASIYNFEGGSGIAKAYKIISADFQNENNLLTMVAKDGVCITEATIYTDNIKASGHENTCD